MKRELRLYFPKVQIRWGVLALFALAIQAIAIFVPLGLDDIPKRLLFVLSYLVLLAFILAIFPAPASPSSASACCSISCPSSPTAA